MIPLIVALFWLGGASPSTGEVLAPGSLEDCLAWSLADAGPPGKTRSRSRGRASLLMTNHFKDLIERGATPAEAIERQRAVIRIARTRVGSGDAAVRDACFKAFPEPTWR